MTKRMDPLPELPPLTIHGLPSERYQNAEPPTGVDHPCEPQKCPFCLNFINFGATACGACGAHLAVSFMSTLGRLVSRAWLILSLVIAWAGSDSYFRVSILFLIAATLSIVGIVLKPRIVWIKN
jgi:hypothetical protein